MSIRKSDPANLALTGMVGYAVTKCFLNKSIFTYMVESAASKEVRSRNQEISNHQRSRYNIVSSAEKNTHSLNNSGRQRAATAATTGTEGSNRQRAVTDTYNALGKETKENEWVAAGSRSEHVIPLANRHRKVAVESY